ncbi:hypothetical protein [Corallococcus sp. AB045]|uniref:hypothetical protein n=1 Tax=Corallococcus sp. AB045 TaxID=2316719 RepID=UPI001F3DB4F6|nr:hypothetical protein [Corallococcus sp. AB045]
MVAAKSLPPSDLIEAAADIVSDTATDDETAYDLLLRITACKTTESHHAITRLTRSLAEDTFAGRPKTGLNLAYSATTIPGAREQIFLLLEGTVPEHTVEMSLSALLHMSQTFSPELEQQFDRIERICLQHPDNTYAQRTFKLITGKELPSVLSASSPTLNSQSTGSQLSSPPSPSKSRDGSLNVPKTFNINTIRHSAIAEHAKNKDYTQRLAELELEKREQELTVLPRLLLGMGSLSDGVRKQTIQVRNDGKAPFSIASAQCKWRLHEQEWRRWLQGISAKHLADIPPLAQPLRVPEGAIREDGKMEIATTAHLKELERYVYQHIEISIKEPLSTKPPLRELLVAEVEVVCQGLTKGRLAIAKKIFSWDPGRYDS